MFVPLSLKFLPCSVQICSTLLCIDLLRPCPDLLCHALSALACPDLLCHALISCHTALEVKIYAESIFLL